MFPKTPGFLFLKNARNAAGLRRLDAGRIIDRGIESVKWYETGRVHPSYGIVKKLLNAYGVPMKRYIKEAQHIPAVTATSSGSLSKIPHNGPKEQVARVMRMLSHEKPLPRGRAVNGSKLTRRQYQYREALKRGVSASADHIRQAIAPWGLDLPQWTLLMRYTPRKTFLDSKGRILRDRIKPFGHLTREK